MRACAIQWGQHWCTGVRLLEAQCSCKRHSQCQNLHIVSAKARCGRFVMLAVCLQVAVRTLTMGSCSSLQGIELSSTQLVRLDVRGCGGLEQLHLNCPALQVLDANFCGSLADEGLASAVANLPPLRQLALSVCCQVCFLHVGWGAVIASGVWAELAPFHWSAWLLCGKVCSQLPLLKIPSAVKLQVLWFSCA